MKTKKKKHERQVVRREMDIEAGGKEWDFRSDGNRKRQERSKEKQEEEAVHRDRRKDKADGSGHKKTENK